LDIHCFANKEKNGASLAKVSEEEIEEAFFYPSDLVNTKTTIPHNLPLFTSRPGDSCILVNF